MFSLRKIEGGRINVFEPQYLTVGATAVSTGEALVLTDGKLVKCGATAKPAFIALADGDANAEIAVGRVESNQIYEVPVSAAPTALTVGSKVTLGADGLTVTATTTSGVAEIVDLNGATASGDIIVVRF